MRLRSLTIIGILASLSATGAMVRGNGPPLDIRFLDEGVNLSITLSGQLVDPIEACEYLSLGGIHPAKIIHALGDIDGHATLFSESAALDFVRLRTSPSTWYLWHHEPTVEVVDRAHLSDIPTFGLPSYANSSAPSGFMGVVSTSEFAAGGFSAPKVEAHGSGFIVTRWLLAEKPKKPDKFSLEHVRETIGPKGAYACRVLSTRAAPKLSDGAWDIVNFR